MHSMMKKKLIISLFLLTILDIGYSQSETIGEEFLTGIPINTLCIYTDKKIPEYNKYPFFKAENVYRLAIYGDKEKKKVNDLNNLVKFKNITELFIFADLETIPDVVFELPNLMKLVISGDKKWDWDQTFIRLSKLKRLRSLKLNNCYSLGVEMPISICQLTQLERLEINHSLIENLPSSFNLHNLKSLTISHSELNVFPELFTNDSLIELDLSWGRFNGIPKEIVNFKNLTKFVFNGNKYYIRDSLLLCQNSKLIRLELANCGLDYLPLELCCLNNLTTLIFYDNNFFELPENIDCFRNLKYIEFDVYSFQQYEKMNSFKKIMPNCTFAGKCKFK